MEEGAQPSLTDPNVHLGHLVPFPKGVPEDLPVIVARCRLLQLFGDVWHWLERHDPAGVAMGSQSLGELTSVGTNVQNNVDVKPSQDRATCSSPI